MKNLRDKKNFKHDERKNNFEVERVGRGNSVNYNHSKLVLNWNKNILP